MPVKKTPVGSLQDAIGKAVNAETGPEVTTRDSEGIAARSTADVMRDPVMVNALSQERWWQSGIQFFGSGGVIWALGVLFTDISQHGTDFAAYDVKANVAALGALGMALGVLYRRFVPGLKPLFWRWGSQ